jgi:hypothetical protein
VSPPAIVATVRISTIQTTTSFTATEAIFFSFLFFCFELESKLPGKKKQKKRERQITEASEESSHAAQCTLNPNPNKGIKISNFVYKISPITGQRVPALARWPVTANNQSPGK